MKVRLRGFWNDVGGLSLPEALSIVFTALYLVVTGLLLARLLAGTLTDQALDFLELVSWPMLTVLGGWFGDRMLSRFGRGSLRPRYRPTYWYDYTPPPEPVDSEPQEGDGRRGTI